MNALVMVSEAPSAAAGGAQQFRGGWELQNWARILTANSDFGSGY
jgi:hypothetical protein